MGRLSVYKGNTLCALLHVTYFSSKLRHQLVTRRMTHCFHYACLAVVAGSDINLLYWSAAPFPLVISPVGRFDRSFRLANAGIRAIGAKAIAAALCANENLEAIDLSGNDLAYKPDDVPGESAEESLKFGLQVRRAK